MLHGLATIDDVDTVDKTEGYQIRVNETSRYLKQASELLKENITSNPKSEKYIQDKKEENKAGKVISSLFRNAKFQQKRHLQKLRQQAVATVNVPLGN